MAKCLLSYVQCFNVLKAAYKTPYRCFLWIGAFQNDRSMKTERQSLKHTSGKGLKPNRPSSVGRPILSATFAKKQTKVSDLLCIEG